MRKFIILLVLPIALALYLFSSQNSISDVFSAGSTSQKKCTTQAGQIYYGDVPKGVTCQNTELVNTSLTVLKSLSENGTESSRMNMKCDGRKYCSQMKSCSEAKFFLQNCPNTSMDGNNDGIPCQKQWCNY